MSTGETLMTPDNAPRDEDTLLAAGAFIHRRLAENLYDRGFKLWGTEREKTAFLTAPPPERARVLSQKLKEMDAASGGAPPSPASPPQLALVPQPPPVEEAPAKRTPRTNGASQAHPVAPPAQPAGPAGGVQELLLALKAMGNQLDSVVKNQERISGGIGGTDVRIKALEEKIAEQSAMFSAVAKLQHIQLGLLCLFGQQVLGNVSIAEFLPASLDDANTALEIFEKLGKG